jgi:CBS domain-containing protein
MDLMSRSPVTCKTTDTLSAAARLMWDCDCGAIPVVGEGVSVKGMITDRDICMAAYTQGRPLDEILVNGAMAKHVVSAHPDQKLGEIEQLMADHQVRRIPVVGDDNKPIGVISLNDVAIESVQPDTKLKNGPSKIGHLLAAICKPRSSKRKAA